MQSVQKFQRALPHIKARPIEVSGNIKFSPGVLLLCASYEMIYARHNASEEYEALVSPFFVLLDFFL